MYNLGQLWREHCYEWVAKKKSYKSQKNKAGFDDVLVFEAQKNNNKCFQCNFNVNIKQICQ